MPVGMRDPAGRRLGEVKYLGVWQALDMWRRIIVVVATLAVFALVLIIARGAARPSMQLLYAGLDPAGAGEVLAALDQRGLAYEVDGSAIYVEAAQRDALRMGLAAEGLPRLDSGGYELLDGLSGFGTTSQMFDVAYWRAKEGELARTIAATPAIRSARVHIAVAPQSGFRTAPKPSASVTVSAAAGISRAQARALRFLVAS